jgi:hypothetical protein
MVPEKLKGAEAGVILPSKMFSSYRIYLSNLPRYLKVYRLLR